MVLPLKNILLYKIGSNTDWSQFSTGCFHSAAIKTDGTLWAWGGNASGQLGDGTTTEKHSPIQIGSGNNWTQIACPGHSTYALIGGNTLWAWGWNNWGQLGDGTYTDKHSPQQIGISTNWSKIATNFTHEFSYCSNKK